MSAVIRDQFSQLSFHGIPRVATAKSLYLRVIWLFLFLTASSVFTAHLVKLVYRYLDFPVNTEVKIESVDFQFPDLYICNPIVLPNSERHEILHSRKKGKKLRSIFRRINKLSKLMDRHFHNKKKELRQFQWSIFWSSITPDIFAGINSEQKVIIRAEMNGMLLPPGSFQSVPHHWYVSCLKFNYPSRMWFKKSKLKLFLYTDSFQINNTKATTMTYRGTQEFDRPSGLRLYFTETGRYPGIRSQSLTASSGMYTKVEIGMMTRRRLDVPNRRCSLRPTFCDFGNHINTSHRVTYKMDNNNCIFRSVLFAYHKKCGCLPNRYPIPIEIFNQTARCLNATHWSLSRIQRNFDCETQFIVPQEINMQELQTLCYNKMNMCEQNIYKLQWSNALWPAANMAKDFVDEIMRKAVNPPFAWRNVLDANETLSLMVRENVLMIEIETMEEKSDHVIESAAYPLINLLSDIGGILGLYMGMSLLSVCELIESFKVILFLACQRKSTKNPQRENMSD